MKKKTLHWVVGVVLVLLVSAILGGVWVARSVLDTIHRAYAVWWVADMVIHHMEENNDAWPSGWEDLKGDYEALTKRSRPWTLEELSQWAEVDWSADPKVLAAKARAGEPPVRVICARNHPDTCWQGREPNEMIFQYFKEKGTTRPDIN